MSCCFFGFGFIIHKFKQKYGNDFIFFCAARDIYGHLPCGRHLWSFVLRTSFAWRRHL